jgi:hypothetical protein
MECSSYEPYDKNNIIDCKTRALPIQSITFEVESNLAKPNRFLSSERIDNILHSIFIRKKQNLDRINRKEIEKNNEIMKILTSSFDTNKKVFYNYEKKSLFRGLMEAYANHYPITISPDMILILFLQGYSRSMEKYSEKLRNVYVNFDGQRTLKVERIGMTPKTANSEDWRGIIDEFTNKIKGEIGESIISYLECNFTTTNSVTLTTSQISIMSSMKNYFKYEVIVEVCGISSITLEGSLEDWEKIKEKIKFFSKEEFGLNPWIDFLIPIIDKIIETKSYYDQNKTITEEIRHFWKDIIRVKKGYIYDPDVLDGWIIKFIPNLSGEKPTIYEKLYDYDIPAQIINCPLKLIFKDKKKIIEYDCSLASGFYGMIQDTTTFNIKPVIGYALVVEDEKIK